jgi:hypothetical protein
LANQVLYATAVGGHEPLTGKDARLHRQHIHLRHLAIALPD